MPHRCQIQATRYELILEICANVISYEWHAAIGSVVY